MAFRCPRRWVLLMAVALTAAACGKKGPPLAPIVRIPAAVQSIAARRVGGEVYITLTVPGQNIDGSMPADVSRVDVYGYTGTTAPPRGRFLEGAAMVATIAVAPPPLPGEPAPSTPPEGATQAAPVTLRDALSAGELVATPLPEPDPDARLSPAGIAAGPAAPVAGPLRRFYMAIALSARGRTSPQGTVAELPLTVLPDPPSHLDVAYTADAVSLAWQPAGGLLGFLLDRALAPELPPFDAAAGAAVVEGGLAPVPPGPTLFNVYRAMAPDPLALPDRTAAPAGDVPPAPVNPAPLAAASYTDPLVLDERQRCYVVRSVRGVAPNVVEGEPSAPVCITPVDVFPPAAPAGLDTIAGDGVISLIWVPNSEPDVAGYLVLRGEAGSDTLAPVTRDGPLAEARFTDDTVTPGVRYVYEVIAVDSRLPLPNRSAAARVEAVAR